MHVVDIGEAKVHLGRLVDEVVGGREVVIARDGEPAVRLVPVEGAQPHRRLGTAAGEIATAPDFDDPLDDFDLGGT